MHVWRKDTHFRDVSLMCGVSDIVSKRVGVLNVLDMDTMTNLKCTCVIARSVTC